MKIESWIPVYEVDGNETPKIPMPQLCVETHWNWYDRVCIHFEGKKLTVCRKDLEAALAACAQRSR